MCAAAPPVPPCTAPAWSHGCDMYCLMKWAVQCRAVQGSTHGSRITPLHTLHPPEPTYASTKEHCTATCGRLCGGGGSELLRVFTAFTVLLGHGQARSSTQPPNASNATQSAHDTSMAHQAHSTEQHRAVQQHKQYSTTQKQAVAPTCSSVRCSANHWSKGMDRAREPNCRGPVPPVPPPTWVMFQYIRTWGQYILSDWIYSTTAIEAVHTCMVRP